MPYSKWDPILAGSIEVTQGTPKEWSHAATLWYMRLPNQAEYRWYEVSYKDNVFSSLESRGPYAVKNMSEADHAAGPGMYAVEIAYGPMPIDAEDAVAFVDRWLERLLQAYQLRLRPF